MAIIKNNNHNYIKLIVSKSEYYDLILSDNNDDSFTPTGNDLYTDLCIGYIDTNIPDCVDTDKLISLTGYTWSEAINNGVELGNIGYTGIDNGLVKFDIDTITDDELKNIITGSTLTILTGDTKLYLNAVSGNTKNYIYPYEYVDNNGNIELKLTGGFFQGFFKSSDNYQILPVSPEKELSFEVQLKPNFNETVLNNTLNYTYPNNKGYFLYLGTRAENKFSYLYNSTGETAIYTGLTTNDNIGIIYDNVTKVETDNKYLFFNRTPNGYMVTTWSGDTTMDYFYNEENNYQSPNKYLSFNRTTTGNTVTNQTGYTENDVEYIVNDDLINNAIGFRITDDGAIGYKMINYSCETNDVWFEEEYSEDNVVLHDNLYSIFIRFILNETNDCPNYSNRKFKINIYVNSKLIFVSKELPELFLRNLNDKLEKQESVPYNISLGGGTQGLIDMINITTEPTLPMLLEQNFAGTFLGNITKFRIFNGKMDYSKILNNYKHDFSESTPSDYIEPEVTLWLEGLNITSPETNYLREDGKTYSLINASIVLRTPYQDITGYKLFYYKNDDPTQYQINGTFSIAPSGGTIQYIHDDLSFYSEEIFKIKYLIEVFDLKRQIIGNKKNNTVNFKDMIFYGDISYAPTGSTDIRTLTNKEFNNVNTITLNTGNVNRRFVIAIPNDKEILNVNDETAMYANITNYYIKSNTITQIENGGNVLKDYNIYIMTNAIKYSNNHKHVITIG